MIFKDFGIDDLGIYFCDVIDTDGIALSYLIDEEGEFKLFFFEFNVVFIF